jgi:hypothetical protein
MRSIGLMSMIGCLILAAAQAFAAAPGNDNFSSAIPLSGASFSTTGTNLDATKEAGEPDHAFVTGGRSVWWAWTSPSVPPASVSITTFGSTFDTVLHVYTGTAVSSLTSVASDNDGIDPIKTSSVTFSPSPATTYYIAVDGVGGASGSIKLELPVTPPANDNFASATVINGSNAEAFGYNFGATKETGEPTNPVNSGGPSVWFSWTAPFTGKARVSTYGSDYDSITAVYSGSAINALTLLGADDDDDIGLADKVVFDAVAGTVYYFAIEGFNGSMGSIRIFVGPGSGGANIVDSEPPVENPLNGITIDVIGSEGGLIQLAVDVESLNRAVFDVDTTFDGINGRVGSMRGTRPFQQFTQPSVFVATSTAIDLADNTPKGKGRKMLPISADEVGQANPSISQPVSRSLDLNKISGKFAFDKTTPDQVAFSGTVELAAGLDLSAEQELSFGLGNVIDRVIVTAKGQAKDKSKGELGRIKKLRVKYPKLPKGTTVTAVGMKASVDITFSTEDMDLKGFDTEGITSSLRSVEVGMKTVPRQIQAAMVLGGISYANLIPVEFKLSTKQDSGQINGRAIRP